jgi:hypothetical protein
MDVGTGGAAGLAEQEPVEHEVRIRDGEEGTPPPGVGLLHLSCPLLSVKYTIQEYDFRTLDSIEIYQ